MRHSYRKRVFLNPVSTLLPSYIMAMVEDSDEGEYKLGSNVITIADCHRHVEFEFFLGTAMHRRRSLRKIDLLIHVLTRFREALAKESKLIDEHEATGEVGIAAKRIKKYSPHKTP